MAHTIGRAHGGAGDERILSAGLSLKPNLFHIGASRIDSEQTAILAQFARGLVPANYRLAIAHASPICRSKLARGSAHGRHKFIYCSSGRRDSGLKCSLESSCSSGPNRIHLFEETPRTRQTILPGTGETQNAAPSRPCQLDAHNCTKLLRPKLLVSPMWRPGVNAFTSASICAAQSQTFVFRDGR